MIDEDFRTWLIEVNNNPYLCKLSDVQYGLTRHMIANVIGITLNPLLEQPVKNNGPDNEFEENKF